MLLTTEIIAVTILLLALLGQINIIFRAVNTLVLNFFFIFVSNKKIEIHLNRKNNYETQVFDINGSCRIRLQQL